MRYTTIINNPKSLQFGINPQQGALMDLFNGLSGWASTMVFEDEVYYFITKQKILDELPNWFTTADNAYRNMRVLVDKRLVELKIHKNKTYIRLTEKGKEWNCYEGSVLKPSSTPDVGEKSEQGSEKNPTYNNTSINTEEKEIYKEKEVDEYRNSELGSKYYPLYSDFYRKELSEALRDGNKNYQIVLEILYGRNSLVAKLENVLSMRYQLTYKQFLSLEEFKKSKPFLYSDVLQRMENYKGIQIKNQSISQTLRNWVRR